MNYTQRLILKGHICPYCLAPPTTMMAADLYNLDLPGYVYVCVPCEASVGANKVTNKPMGRLAKKELRYLKREAHANFDAIWKIFQIMSRTESYI